MGALFLWIWLRKVFKGGKRRGGKGRGGERERRVGGTKGEREREGRGEGEGEGESEGGKTLIMIQEVVVCGVVSTNAGGIRLLRYGSLHGM